MTTQTYDLSSCQVNKPKKKIVLNLIYLAFFHNFIVHVCSTVCMNTYLQRSLQSFLINYFLHRVKQIVIF